LTIQSWQKVTIFIINEKSEQKYSGFSAYCEDHLGTFELLNLEIDLMG
jgi:hypothetical protein